MAAGKYFPECSSRYKINKSMTLIYTKHLAVAEKPRNVRIIEKWLHMKIHQTAKYHHTRV